MSFSGSAILRRLLWNTTMMQRAMFSRSTLLLQQAAATNIDGALGARSAPLLQQLERSMSTVTIPPPACMLRPLEAPLRYLFGPGPSNIPPRILTAGGRPIIGHMHSEMFEVIILWKSLKLGMFKLLCSNVSNLLYCNLKSLPKSLVCVSKMFYYIDNDYLS